MSTRLETELALLHAMYPSQLSHHPQARELHFTLPSPPAGFTLRLPETYPEAGVPEVLAASLGLEDLREAFRERVGRLGGGEGEVLDAWVGEFEGLVGEREGQGEGEREGEARDVVVEGVEEGKATVVVWLHHLLNANKRKQALSAPAGVAGVTKPGYPGVLVFSGAAGAVREHVEGLKGLQWAAFQVRLEREEVWGFAHGEGVVEVGGMGDVVREVGERREVFMEAMRMK